MQRNEHSEYSCDKGAGFTIGKMSQLLMGMCRGALFSVFKPAHLCFTFSLSIFSIVMSVFSLNDISVTVALDSAYPVSLVARHTASVFDTLAVVTVACRPVQAVWPFNCILDFGLANNLPVDCVLGCDYFACLSVAL